MLTKLFLVDTSAWILVLRKDYSPVLKERIELLLKENAVAIAGIVKLELLGGTKSEKEFQRLKSRLDALHTVECNVPLWERSYRLAFKLRRKGIIVPYTDILIAACAQEIEATVLHVDAHFDLMQKPVDLRVESYVKELEKLHY